MEVLEIARKIDQLNRSVKELRNTGTAYAQAERDYKVALRTEALKLRDEGMAVTLIDKIVYGIPAVADKRFERDVAEAIYDANKEAINAIKLQIRILNEQIAQDWGAAKYD